jgi:hypothetical protein
MPDLHLNLSVYIAKEEIFSATLVSDKCFWKDHFSTKDQLGSGVNFAHFGVLIKQTR